ncbi:MAG TPA: ABC transporter permease subunit [Nocardioides sp.]|jgi:ABC-type transport system involved in multi-copper enzyme maturation permease subunit|nr:ABC transporter permease subunit [Nocardioides sp.]
MSATTAPTTLDVSHTATVPFGRLVSVELRKLADTRAGRWLLIAIAGLTLLVLIIQLSVVLGQDLHPKYIDFLQGMNTPMGILLPVLGVLTVTSEWSQRTAMVTFTLEPSRVRVIAAKFVSILLISVVALVIGVLLGALANALYGALSGHTVVWGNPAKFAFYYLLLYIFGMATGFAFGALFLNSPAGIVIYFVYSFVLPTIFGIAAALMNWFESLQPWIDFNNDQSSLIDATITGKDWAQLAVSGIIWLVVPMAIGIWRIRRAEVK